MLGAYLAFLVLSVVILSAAKLQYCQELALKGSVLRKDVATMVFTMDSTCLACYHEIQKLVRLKTQMARMGHNAQIMVALDQISRGHTHQLPSEVTLDLGDAWAKLGRLNGHIFVFDKCGKLAYQVITPWSRQVYPFTAMAGLSALYDAPCGECNATAQVKDELQEVPESFSRLGSQWRNQLPLTIGEGQIHNGSRVTHNTEELTTIEPNHQNATYGAFETRDSKPNVTTVQRNATQKAEDPKNILHEDTSSRDTVSSVSTDKNGVLQGSDGVPSKTETSGKPPASRNEYSTLMKHYQPLMKWRKCATLVMNLQV